MLPGTRSSWANSWWDLVEMEKPSAEKCLKMRLERLSWALCGRAEPLAPAGGFQCFCWHPLGGSP